MFYLSLPIIFLKFWYFEAPIGIVRFFSSLNSSALALSSLPLLIKTYFKPWKNEYRKGLVVFSIVMGIFIKTFVIAADLVIFLLILFLEISFFVFFILWPIATAMLIFT
ncbi:MAG: hypothetical protein A2860_01005 [Candidatus Levybacteria bacterium RIFCSPHIGHO2_01_FULL_37_33]|nr:MAG: hypothetical protein A2860_01005 [Candidatus Levybacteria bacterium RIFCSPHIGHO2_01_FULL_37_33]OGH29092.1 MAG: hypothetical protein A3F30_00880 [Candidatus Levybacteria bacterium RIFCSPHIGHO2_12_FULL_37_12]OGH32515.1 MAG: hypothetical protein A2953_02560 [Candidatus Levybacteria bacterium RIFCSPLOWO2_01_FULL_36_54]